MKVNRLLAVALGSALFIVLAQVVGAHAAEIKVISTIDVEHGEIDALPCAGSR
jgi:hypothetical protein